MSLKDFEFYMYDVLCRLYKSYHVQGRSQDLGGGARIFFPIWKLACREATCSTWKSHAIC